MPKPLILIPTYNEAKNIEVLINQILSLNISCLILVVDDNSPDGTGKIVDKLALRHPQIKIIHRQGKRGRGLAGIEGMLYFLQEKEMDCLIEMDADLSHDPSYIPKFLKEIQDYDLVIGSRTIKEGAERHRHIIRKWISLFAHVYLRLILGLKVRDPSSGYRCFRKEVLAKIGLDKFISQGPSLVSEILYVVSQKNNFSIKEIPIIFEDRKFGDSKLTLKILLQNLIFPLRLRLNSLLQKFK
ncbi:MAG: polyprenol monophosphomannose synthase [bacterium]